MPSLPRNGANQARSRKLASERKSYQLTYQKDQHEEKPFFCITETRLASGAQRTFPNKWQVSTTTRTPLHRTQQPAKSIFRPRATSTTTSRPSPSPSESQGRKGHLRFSSRVDQRFYIKHSHSSHQLVKLSWDGPDSLPAAFDMIDISTSPCDEDYNDGVQDFIDAVTNGWSVQKLVPMIQEDVDRSQQDPSQDWLLKLYDSIKRQVKEYSPSPTSNLTQVRTLLSIYKNAEGAIQSARALKQWSRFEVTIESINNLHLKETDVDNEDPLIGEMYYSSNRMPSKILGKLPSTRMNGFVDYTKTASSRKEGGKRYCFNHNLGNADEKPQLTLHLRQGKQALGSVVLPSACFKYFSTQPTKTYSLERQLAPDACLEKGARVKFSIQKVPFKPGFLDSKRKAVSSRIHDLVRWIHKFNTVNASPEGSPLLSANICAQDNVSLLHAAIYAQDVGLVRTLMTMGANPYLHSNIGSAMTLALNQSDQWSGRQTNNKQLFDDMIKLMQETHRRGSNTTTSDDQSTIPASSKSNTHVTLNAKENDPSTIPASKNKSHHSSKGKSQRNNKTGKQKVLGELDRNTAARLGA